MIPRVHNTSYRTSLRICPSAPSPESANQTPPPPVLRDISHNHLRHFTSAIGHGSSNEIDSTATSFPNRKAATLNIRHGFPHTTHTMCWELCTNGLPPPVHINWSILKRSLQGRGLVGLAAVVTARVYVCVTRRPCQR